MTQVLITHLNKRIAYNLLSALDFTKITLPGLFPVLQFRPASTNASSVINCACGWKGSEMKANKHYLEVEGIAELELYCPKCSQYLCFISESSYNSL